VEVAADSTRIGLSPSGSSVNVGRCSGVDGERGDLRRGHWTMACPDIYASRGRVRTGDEHSSTQDGDAANDGWAENMRAHLHGRISLRAWCAMCWEPLGPDEGARAGKAEPLLLPVRAENVWLRLYP
jgi:hypothetical protein